jgi:hypothetical protein
VTNGTIYRCVQTHSNRNPETDVTNTYWIVAFASAGDFYTKAEADGAFLSKTLNGSDILNPAAFRNNLSVYSQAQTYTKTEVDSKTTVASTAQAQAWISNTTLLTPLRLLEAFKGSNQTLNASGFQKIPGGLIVQWVSTTTSVSGFSTITLPVTFPNGIVGAVFTSGDNAVSPTQRTFATTGPATNSQVRVYATNSAGNQVAVSVFGIVIGY